MTKRTIQASENITDSIDCLKISDVIEKLTSLAKAYGPSATLRVATINYPYDDRDYPAVNLEYERPETDMEEQQRLDDERARKEARRRAFEQLKKEFDP